MATKIEDIMNITEQINEHIKNERDLKKFGSYLSRPLCIVNYEKCSCGKKATWCYMPGTDDGNNCFCDDCVPRGCTCNINRITDAERFGDDLSKNNCLFYDKNMENPFNNKLSDSVYYEILDVNGRRVPCCEYMYDENGFEKFLSYKDFDGSIEWSDADDCYCGKIINVSNGILASYEGNTIEELEKDFVDCCEDLIRVSKQQ